MTWRFPVRNYGSRKPARPRNSFYRTGYARTAGNPRGYHKGCDIPMPVGTIKQAPARCRITWKGWYGKLGRLIEVQILEGYDKGRYFRMAHCQTYTSKPVGTILPAAAALGRIGLTGNTSGPHDHEELARYSIRKDRDPRWDLTDRLKDAWDRYVAA